jgi:hypothetical protein
VTVRKATDESVASSTALQNDDELAVPLGLGEVWIFEAWIGVFSSSATGDFKLSFTVPAGATIRWSGLGAGNTGTDHEVITSSGATDVYQITGSGGITDSIVIHGTVVNGLTAGNLQMQWAQNTSTSAAVVVQTGSYLWAGKL